MNGHVFQTHTAQNKRGQFQDTLNMLKVYASNDFKEDTSYLTPMFTQLKVPEAPKPADPI